jgi:predicted chitinase
MPVLKKSQMPDASPRRIICHWTAGGYKASATDRKHYHFLVENDGNIVAGIRSIKDNDSTGDGKYAAHTFRSNTKSIGLSVCCMAGATKTNPGRFPMTELQWRRMAEVAAELCKRYQIPVTPKTVLGHFEVERILGIRQRGKWDPGFLPWDPNAKEPEVGRRFRSVVEAFLDKDNEPDETPGSDIAVAVEGKAISGAIETNEETLVPVKTLVEDLKWDVPYANESHAVLDAGGDSTPMYLAFSFLDETIELDEDEDEEQIIKQVVENGYVLANDIANEMDLPIAFDEGQDVLAIGEKPKRTKTGAGETKHKQVIVRRGDTLAKIAAIHLSNGSRWTELLKPDGTPFTREQARRLQVGQVVLVPTIEDEEAIPPVGEIAHEPPADLKSSGIDLDLLVNAAQPGFRRFALESLPVIVAECISSGVMMPEQVAYVLATSEHESGCGKWMKELWGPTSAQRGYEGRRDLGNTHRGDGLRFRGRGYVQITGRRNYTLWARRLGIDIVARPDLVATDPSLAARILVQGMRDGSFTGKKLADYFRSGEEPDFFNARAMINGDKRKNGEKIAGHARRYLAAMTRPTDPD